ncbi:MAG: transposase [Candidatus Zixiibacteriota bacterium]
MTNIRRYHRKDDLIFLTHVTHERMPILLDNSDLLLDSLARHTKTWSAEVLAWVILPDHFHLLLDIRQSELSSLMRKVKLSFSAGYRIRQALDRGRVWQNRFYDHIIRDADDLNRHIDYIHYNPVKHGLVHKPIEYAASSLGDFSARGYYSRDWGEHFKIDTTIEYGE